MGYNMYIYIIYIYIYIWNKYCGSFKAHILSNYSRMALTRCVQKVPQQAAYNGVLRSHQQSSSISSLYTRAKRHHQQQGHVTRLLPSIALSLAEVYGCESLLARGFGTQKAQHARPWLSTSGPHDPHGTHYKALLTLTTYGLLLTFGL